ncbi:DUF3887 domain-containing protein [Haloimpatiens sp. FM7315]|uniref:DUF3887 domain-containing protein n=1 Tax=Haloimpatiens sp. FM7315 TaxID=3298609 RepID=UPI0035A32C08
MKRFSKVIMMILCVAMIFSCGCGAKKLSASYSEDKLKTASEEIIKDLNDEKYEEVTDKLSKDIKDKLPASKLEEVWDKYKEMGDYQSISKIAFQEKDNYAVVVAVAKFKEGKVIFTLSYNKDMELVGIFIK